MTDWQVVWLGVMAVALVVMAAVQVGLVVAALRAGRELLQTTRDLRREITPLVQKAHRIADEAARAVALGTAQVQHVDRMLASTAVKVDQTVQVVQTAVVGPIRQAAAVVAAVRAVVAGVRLWRERPHHHAREDEETLFVG